MAPRLGGQISDDQYEPPSSEDEYATDDDGLLDDSDYGCTEYSSPAPNTLDPSASEDLFDDEQRSVLNAISSKVSIEKTERLYRDLRFVASHLPERTSKPSPEEQRASAELAKAAKNLITACADDTFAAHNALESDDPKGRGVNDAVQLSYRRFSKKVLAREQAMEDLIAILDAGWLPQFKHHIGTLILDGHSAYQNTFENIANISPTQRRQRYAIVYGWHMQELGDAYRTARHNKRSNVQCASC